VLRPGELQTAFAGLEILAVWEGVREPSSRPVACLAARRLPREDVNGSGERTEGCQA